MKERLTGAIILVALLVLLVPELLTGPESKQPAQPAGAAGAQLRSYTIDLQDDAANRQPPSVPAAAAADEPVGQAAPEVETDVPPAVSVAPPVDEATRASGTPMGSGADVSAATPERQSSAATPEGQPSAARPGSQAPAARPEGPASVAKPESQTSVAKAEGQASAAKSASQSAAAARAGTGAAAGTAVSAEDDKPRSAFGPNAVARAQPAAPDAAKASPSKGWAVQLGVFASRENADRLAKEVKGSGYPVVINEMSGNGKKLYRVRVGPEAERAAAVALGAKLRAAGHAGSVVPYP